MPSSAPALEAPLERRVLWLVTLVQLVNVLDFVMVMPLGRDFARALDFPESKLGLIGGAYTLAAAKAPDWQAFQELHELASGVLKELELHQGIATAWELNLEQISPGGATRRYTDFLLATAWS
ncbi:MAG TPA: hypothetical protein PKU97_17110, partial [Kofleriaceae bacterium]|nr:hypothetical protein [Kofleriaceae bacterium]